MPGEVSSRCLTHILEWMGNNAITFVLPGNLPNWLEVDPMKLEMPFATFSVMWEKFPLVETIGNFSLLP